jgi:hypothetical protein
MPRKRPKKFSAAKQARKRARETLGTPPPTRVIADVRKKKPKHKHKFGDQE